MSRKKLLVLTVACIVILATSLAAYFQLSMQPKTSWMAVGDFVVYQQGFAWAGGNATKYMFWNVTALSGGMAYIHLVSHGLTVTGGQVNFATGDANLTVNVSSREVMASASDEMPVGSKFPFWIPQTVKAGDPMQTSYGDSTVSPSQTLRVMGQSRVCWLVAYAYGAGSNMNRYFDTASGICLLIQSHIYSNGVSIAVNETAVQTNIKSI